MAGAQYYLSANNKAEPELLWEAGISAGIVNCLTDIGGNNGKGKRFVKDINWNESQWGLSVFANATWHYQFAIRLEAALAHIAGTDKVLNNSQGLARARYLRNLQFRTSLEEVSLLTELYPLMIINSSRNVALLSPYIIAGTGVVHFNPQAWLSNQWISLRPLHTEGEGFKEYANRANYKPVSWCIPIGAGIKYDAGTLVNLRFEILYRFTGTDYLDDVSTRYIDPQLFSHYLSPQQSRLAIQLSDRSTEINAAARNHAGDIRGNASNRDAYFSFMIKATIVLGRLPNK